MLRMQENNALNGQACKIPLSFGDSQSERGIFTPGQLLLTPSSGPRLPDPLRGGVLRESDIKLVSGGSIFPTSRLHSLHSQSQTFTETQTERPFLNT